MIAVITALLLAVQAAPSPTLSPLRADVEAQNEPRLRTAAQLLKDHEPQQALDILTIALAAYDADHASEKRRLYCGMSPQETLLYMMMAAKDKTSAVAVPPGYCTALYLKGYALVDLGQPAEAKAVYRQAIALAPMYAQYQTELGQLLRLDKDWPGMLSTCEGAAQAAAIAPAAIKMLQQGAALRCQGYALVEEHKLDEAEKRYRQALAINPGDLKAQGELQYIAQQRAKP
ncbi:tetratricopeptide repeat protein [Sphingomonas bacterium]|uniref:tetratricopeptide repeat protein n=1 Tax=Sphingomonas bacterium TaxID=1895847 RepID=UPI0015755254|nr:tetratricopeptide repeat protein [Sphingomonas bacterium]